LISTVNNNNLQSKVSSQFAPNKSAVIARSSDASDSARNDNFAKIPVASLKAYALSFSAAAKEPQQVTIPTRHIENVVKSVQDKKYHGAALYIPEGETTPSQNIQWSKVKWENLKQEPINWKTAKKEDILSFWSALALCEVQETNWVNKFNPTNSLTALSTGHAISSPEAKIRDEKRLQELTNWVKQGLKTVKSMKDADIVISPIMTEKQKALKESNDASLKKLKEKLSKKGHPVYLDQPLIDPKTGKFAIDFTVFDTETTGVGDNDRIIQIGAAQFKDGKPTKAYNKFFDPEMEVPQGAVNVHGLSRQVLLEKHKAKPLHDSLANFTQKVVGNNLLVAYNAQFDIGKINHEIDLHNLEQDKEVLKKKEQCLTLDPFLMLQRIHPFVGVRKRLGEQYKFFFGKDLEGTAHDALDDVNATVDILKYTALALNKNFKPSKDKKALTVGDFLTFQFGGEVKGLNIKLDKELKINNNKTYDWSYRYSYVRADGFPDGCTLNKGNFENLENKYGEVLGKSNIATLKRLGEAMNETKTPSYSPQSIVRILNSDEYKIEDNNGVPKDKLIKLICENSPNAKSNFQKTLWVKNINPWDTQNDLPDMEISRQVMLDKSPAQIKALVKKGKLADLSNQEQPEYYTKFKS